MGRCLNGEWTSFGVDLSMDMDGWMDEYGQMDGWVGRWMSACMGGRTHEWMMADWVDRIKPSTFPPSVPHTTTFGKL